VKNKIIALVATAALASAITAFAAQGNATEQKSKKKNSNAAILVARTNRLEKEVQALKEQVADLKISTKEDNIGSMAELYAHGPAVVTSPALGVRRSAEDASDLMVNLPSMNEDLVILRTRQKMDNYAKKNCILIPERPIIAVSGGAEGQIQYTNDYDHSRSADVDLTKAELDFIGEASPWATAALILSYDNGGIVGIPNRVRNSRLTLSRGFITIGQLNKSPIYGTLGQVYLPFGRYANYRVTTPSTQVIGRIKERAVILGFDYAGFYGQIYGFPGETYVPGSIQLIQRGGANLGYKYSSDDKFAIDMGVGTTGNMAEAWGMQGNGMSAPNFAGFNSNETLVSRVPGLDAYAKIVYKPITLIGEYIAATRNFDAVDMTFDGRGARPSALDAEAAYSFTLFCKPNDFVIGYGQSWQALALNIPRQDVFATYQISIWKDTIESLEYRHNFNYGWGDIATGNNGSVPITIIGRNSNSVTFQIGVYF